MAKYLCMHRPSQSSEREPTPRQRLLEDNWRRGATYSDPIAQVAGQADIGQVQARLPEFRFRFTTSAPGTVREQVPRAELAALEDSGGR